jgi:hypothetical protein
MLWFELKKKWEVNNEKIIKTTKKATSQESAAHACNPSCLESRARERLGFSDKFVRPYLKKTQHKIGLVEWLKW